MARETVLLAAGLAALVTCAAPVGCRLASAPAIPEVHDAAVVLLSGPDRVVTVDLVERRPVADVRLRSHALDLAIEPATGIVVTAQCGGVGDAADDVAGLYDVRRGGPVRYVKLPRANPGTVACLRGRAYIQHGVYEGGGLFLSVVDPVRGKVVGSGIAPDGPGASMASRSDGLAVLESMGGDAGPSRVTAIRISDLATDAIAPCPAGTAALVADEHGRLALIGGGASLRSPDAPWFAEMDARGRIGPRAGLAGIDSVGDACLTGIHAAVVAADDGAREPTSSVVVVDRRSGRTVGSVPVPGVAIALCAWGDRLLAVTRDPCRLVVIDPALTRIVFEVDLGAREVIAADVEVLHGRSSGRSVSGRASP